MAPSLCPHPLLRNGWTVKATQLPSAIALGGRRVQDQSSSKGAGGGEDFQSETVLGTDRDQNSSCVEIVVSVGQQLRIAAGEGGQPQIHAQHRRNLHADFIDVEGHAAAMAV